MLFGSLLKMDPEVVENPASSRFVTNRPVTGGLLNIRPTIPRSILGTRLDFVMQNMILGHNVGSYFTSIF